MLHSQLSSAFLDISALDISDSRCPKCIFWFLFWNMSFTNRAFASQPTAPLFTQLPMAATNLSLTFPLSFLPTPISSTSPCWFDLLVFICTLSSSSYLHCPFCSRILTSCLDDGNSLLVGPTLYPVSSSCTVIMLHPAYKCLDGSPLYFAGKSSHSLLWSTSWMMLHLLCPASLFFSLPCAPPQEPPFLMVSLTSTLSGTCSLLWALSPLPGLLFFLLHLAYVLSFPLVCSLNMTFTERPPINI